MPDSSLKPNMKLNEHEWNPELRVRDTVTGVRWLFSGTFRNPTETQAGREGAENLCHCGSFSHALTTWCGFAATMSSNQIAYVLWSSNDSLACAVLYSCLYLLAVLLVELVVQSQACVQRGQTRPQFFVFLTNALQSLLQHLFLLWETQHLKKQAEIQITKLFLPLREENSH